MEQVVQLPLAAESKGWWNCGKNQYFKFKKKSYFLHPTNFKLLKVKVKVIPQQAWTGPRGSGSVKAPDFLDVRHYEGGRSSAKRTGRLYTRRNPWYWFSEAESTPGHMVPSGPRKKSPATPPGIDPGTVWLVAQYLNHHTTPGPLSYWAR